MITLFSPGKINFFLRVVSKRPDGFHNISSILQTISLGDVISMDLAESDSFTCSDSNLSCDQTNLVCKALRLFRSKAGISASFKIHLEKKIPIQAGLGGGSSNAATVLWGCNQLTGMKYSTNDLLQWGSEIGSDIPFFFSKGTAYCTGRGEFVQDLPSPPQNQIWIVKPQIGLSTPAVFKELSFGSGKYPHLQNSEPLSLSFDSLSYINDLEFPAFALEPRLIKLKQKLLESGFQTVLMTGTGSSFFCMGEGNISEIKELNLKKYEVHFVNRHANAWYIP